jgi:hypothetical protein
MLPLIAASIGAVGNLASSAIQASASRRAAAQQEAAIREGLNKANGIYDEAAGQYDPYTAAGANAASSLPGMVSGMKQPGFDYKQSDFNYDAYKDPGVEVALRSAAQSLNASSLAKGATGGGAMKAMATEQANIAQGGYKNAWERWLGESQMRQGQAESGYTRDADWQNGQFDKTAGIATMGASAASSKAGVLSSKANAQFAPFSEMGGARGAGTVGSANALTNGIGGLVDNAATYLGRSSTPGTQVWNPSTWTVPSAPASGTYSKLGEGLYNNDGTGF